jgi:hypothetical protein
VEAVLAATAAHPTNEHVQYAACCLALYGLLRNCPANCSKAVAAGAPGALVAAMRSFPLHTQIQASACHILATLADKNCIAVQVGSCGAVEAVVAALQANGGGAHVAKHACKALMYLLYHVHANCTMAHAAGAVSALIAVLQLPASHSLTVASACSAIMSLAAAYPERTAAGGAIEALTKVLRAHRSDANVQMAACTALHALVQHSAANSARAVRAGAVDELKATMLEL